MNAFARPSRLALSAALVAVIASPQFAVAQQRVIPGQLENFTYQAAVLVEHDGGINGTMRRPVMDFISNHLEAQAKKATGGDYPWPFHVEFEARANDEFLSRRVYYLKVMWAGRSYLEEDAQRFFEAARQELEKRFRVVQKQTHEASLEQWIVHQQRLQQTYEGARRRLDDITAQMQVKGDGRLIDQTREELREVRAQQREFNLQQVGVTARRRAIEARIDELREVAQAKSSDDPIVAEMRKAVALREKAVEIQKTPGVPAGRPGGPALAINEAEAAWTEARIQLLKAERDAMDRAQGSVLVDLNNELSTLIVKDAELEEKRKSIERIVATLEEQASPDRIAEVELLESERRDAQDAVSNARRQLREHEGQRPGDLEQITIRPLEEALFGDDPEAPPAESL
jgi:hypothetical protein